MSNPQYPTNKSALLMVDVLNDFFAPSGKVNAAIQPQIEQLGLIASLTRLLKGARAAGLPIAYAPHGLHEHAFDDVKYVPVRMQYAMEHQVFWMGESGSDFFEPFRPQEGDIVSSRHRTFNGFMGTDLDEKLKAAGIEQLIFAGLTSQTCVEGTARHATEAGYHVTFLTDAVAEFTPEAHKAALEISYPTFGHEVLTVDQLLAAITKPI